MELAQFIAAWPTSPVVRASPAREGCDPAEEAHRLPAMAPLPAPADDGSRAAAGDDASAAADAVSEAVAGDGEAAEAAGVDPSLAEDKDEALRQLREQLVAMRSMQEEHELLMETVAQLRRELAEERTRSQLALLSATEELRGEFLGHIRTMQKEQKAVMATLRAAKADAQRRRDRGRAAVF
eukprot:PLAT4322.1.p2 GENE.PLAT4322.1~~PLAT4322.1.p2  ORF type:complete len:182 (+),score=58.04 PLAT4322.1:582-1127(+)